MGRFPNRLLVLASFGILGLLGCGGDDEVDCGTDVLNNFDFVDVTVQFTGFDEHVGQVFKMRIYDLDLSEEISRKTLDPILGPAFTLRDNGVCGGHTRIDFYADMNGNRRYDPPPVDHAWRIFIGDPEKDITVSFAHDSNYVDVHFPD